MDRKGLELMAKSRLLTQTFTYNNEIVHLSGTLESITHLRKTLELMESYQNFLKEATQLLQCFVDSREEDQVENKIDLAAGLLQKIQAIGNLTSPTLIFTGEEQYNNIILDLRIGIKKQKDLLEYYENEYAKKNSPYKEGEIYKSPQGINFYISQVKASKEKHTCYAVYGIRCSLKEPVESILKKQHSRIRPNPKWKKL